MKENHNIDFVSTTKALLDIQAKLQEVFEPIFEAQKQLNKTFSPCLLILEKFKQNQEYFELKFKDLRASYPDDLILIAQNGWYISLDSLFGTPNYLADLLRNFNSRNVDKYLIDYYENSIKRIFESLKSNHKNRLTIFEELEALYYDEYYFGFISLALSQIDGICFDFTTQKFFLKDKKNSYYPEVYVELEKINNLFLKILISPFKNNSPILAHESNLHNFPCKLNRHKILHGVDTEYGTKNNALKIFSLLVFISELLSQYNEISKKSN